MSIYIFFHKKEKTTTAFPRAFVFNLEKRKISLAGGHFPINPAMLDYYVEIGDKRVKKLEEVDEDLYRIFERYRKALATAFYTENVLRILSEPYIFLLRGGEISVEEMKDILVDSLSFRIGEISLYMALVVGKRHILKRFLFILLSKPVNWIFTNTIKPLNQKYGVIRRFIDVIKESQTKKRVLYEYIMRPKNLAGVEWIIKIYMAFFFFVELSEALKALSSLTTINTEKLCVDFYRLIVQDPEFFDNTFLLIRIILSLGKKIFSSAGKELSVDDLKALVDLLESTPEDKRIKVVTSLYAVM
ncbi:hypothetical protein DRP04_03925 [Archaeoglobales archaeon]|nr:MAG: hypothetical protein DRP04_03925 [Archaeoglobales archaeon]